MAEAFTKRMQRTLTVVEHTAVKCGQPLNKAACAPHARPKRHGSSFAAMHGVWGTVATNACNMQSATEIEIET